MRTGTSVRNQESEISPINLGVCSTFFLPYLTSAYLTSEPTLAWGVAWAGSLWIFAAVLSGLAGGEARRLTLSQQVLKPIFLIHAIFAGYGFVSSIFYFLELSGLKLAADAPIFRYPSETLAALAVAQQYYVLAHASLACGMLLATKRNIPREIWCVSSRATPATILLSITALASVATVIVGYLPGLSQLGAKVHNIGIVAAAMSLGASATRKGRAWFAVSLCLNAFLFLLAIASGWKEAPLVLVILISISLHFRYPLLAKVFGIMAIFMGLVTLPTISAAIRKLSGDETSTAPKLSRFQIAQVGINAVLETTADDFRQNTWRFLTDRISEASMFVRYIESVETTGNREGVAILKQAALTPIPRIIWKGKPNIEELVRIRVLNHNIVSEQSQVSAKPHPVVDAYLVGGGVGIVLTFLGLGAFASFASSLCERLLGGYLLGGVFFNGLFSILWRGGCFEFMVNSLVWSLILMFAIHWVGVHFGYLIRQPVQPRR